VIDRRLFGTWRSDKRRTAREIKARKGFQPKKAAKLLSLFGKLEHTYAKTRRHSRLNGEVIPTKYKVVATDEESVVIVSTSRIAGDLISHLHFEGPSLYWVTVGGRFREYFRRISK
jgi:hypothetical protein